jgi:hypothetical protein
MAMLVRYLIETLLDQEDDSPKTKGKKVDTYMRVWERRKKVIQLAQETDDYLNYDGTSFVLIRKAWLTIARRLEGDAR